jgi:hypothetical protein
MRLMVARCSIDYSGRLTTHLAEATRLLMTKADGTFMVWSDHGGQSVKPLNWMTPPTVIEQAPDRLVVRKFAGTSEDRLEIVLHEVISDQEIEMASPEADHTLTKDGVEAFAWSVASGRPTSAPSTSCAATRRTAGSRSRSSAWPGSRRSSS